MSTVINNERFRKLLKTYPDVAVRQLHDLFATKLLNYAAQITKDREAARDIIQETFLHVFINSKQLSRYHKQSIQHYLVRVVRFKSISYFTSEKLMSLDDLIFQEDYRVMLTESSEETNIIHREVITEIRALIATFPPKERECLLLMVDHNLDLDEIAVQLNVTRKAIERSITSARKRLRKWSERL